jgi:hypothetical protein
MIGAISVTDFWLVRQICVWEGQGSDLVPETGCTEDFRYFKDTFHTNAGEYFKIGPGRFPPRPSTSLIFVTVSAGTDPLVAVLVDSIDTGLQNRR